MQVEIGIEPPSEPEIEPGAASDAYGEPELVVPAEVDPTIVRAVVKGTGNTACYLFSDEDVPEQWRFTDRELDDLIPPLTRYINRNAHLRAAVMRGDEMTIAMVLAGYGGRNYEDGRRAAKIRKERDAIITREAGTSPGPAAQSGDVGGTDQPDVQPRGSVPATLARGRSQ